MSITCDDRDAEALARHLAAREIYAWHGNFYALELCERLGLEARGGFLRLGLVHYNTAEEVDYVIDEVVRHVERLRALSPDLEMTVRQR